MAIDIFGKSAKMWVHEICVKQTVTPKWDCKEVEPKVVPPKFICQCIISYTDKTLTAEAVGKTKKEAQQEAALLMLYKRLGMTPAMLDALNKASKTKSSGSGDTSVTDGIEGDEQIHPVSDTDDSEMSLAPEPVSELFALCNVNDLEEPVYSEVKMEGPSHKRVFTISCSVQVKDKEVSLTARRYRKQAAKKLSAYRVLRELKNQGYEYIAFQASEDDDDSGEGKAGPSKPSKDRKDNNSSTNNAALEAIAQHFNSLSLMATSKDGQSLSQRELLLKYCGKPICDDTSEDCITLLVNYPHAFQHIKPSSTMEETLTKPNLMQAINEYGGALPLLQKIVTDMKITAQFIPSSVESETKEICYFLRFKFPFDFKQNIPKSTVVNGVAMTEDLAKDAAAIEGLKLLRNLFFEIELPSP
ncbi:Interferon-inducible double-stranded RNA-dependent protein kinase activator A A [Orchesella cincta]|uniref:Interferon-inducible double-stranded RNA-dependent protein kinase activator A A n=1 Tax=Orchesella cincta TaxID=48709 RepID=A0A1D2N8F0_ORCCI|nr:Interferon-inducible double-stranded RNA-dependent protein kinase activator A A [Orchesella cincta]